jgi:predicted metal-binding protein
MPRPRVLLDSSQWITVLTCTGCPGWRDSRPTKAEALALGADHMDRVHSQARLAADLRVRVGRLNGSAQQ